MVRDYFTKEETESIKKVLESEVGKTLKDYLLAKLKSLHSIERVAIKDTPTHQTIEIRAQLKAYLVLRDILDAIMIVELDKGKEEKKEEDNLVPGL